MSILKYSPLARFIPSLSENVLLKPGDGNRFWSFVGEKSEESQVGGRTQPTAEEAREGALQPVVPASFSFAIIGDTQRFKVKNSHGGLQLAVKNILTSDVDFLISVGDVSSGCEDDCMNDLTMWKNILGSLMPKTYPLMGNHDRSGKSVADTAWQEAFDLPTNGPPGYSELVYSFDFQNSHFVILNTEKPKSSVVDQVQRDWLEEDLALNRKENTFIFFHRPAYPVSSKIDSSLDAHPDDRDALWNIFTRYGVTAVFNGHEHIHSRKKIGDIYQFVFGNTDSYNHDLPEPGITEYSYQGKTYGIVEIDGGETTVNLYSVEGRLINTFQLTHK